MTNGVCYVLIQDDTYLIGPHFEDLDSIGATMNYTFADAGTAGSKYSMSQCELLLYAFADGLKN